MKKEKRFNLLFITCFCFLIITLLTSHPFPKTILSLNDAEIASINQNRGLYASSFFARLLDNKLTYLFYKYKTHFFQAIDQNYYFFANHPRERAGIAEKVIFPWVVFPFFLIGIYHQFNRKYFSGFIYCLLVVTIASFFANFEKYLFFTYPFFLLTMLFGVGEFLSRMSKKR